MIIGYFIKSFMCIALTILAIETTNAYYQKLDTESPYYQLIRNLLKRTQAHPQSSTFAAPIDSSGGGDNNANVDEDCKSGKVQGCPPPKDKRIANAIPEVRLDKEILEILLNIKLLETEHKEEEFIYGHNGE